MWRVPSGEVARRSSRNRSRPASRLSMLEPPRCRRGKLGFGRASSFLLMTRQHVTRGEDMSPGPSEGPLARRRLLSASTGHFNAKGRAFSQRNREFGSSVACASIHRRLEERVHGGT
jgi:hypothetical protein